MLLSPSFLTSFLPYCIIQINSYAVENRRLLSVKAAAYSMSETIKWVTNLGKSPVFIDSLMTTKSQLDVN